MPRQHLVNPSYGVRPPVGAQSVTIPANPAADSGWSRPVSAVRAARLEATAVRSPSRTTYSGQTPNRSRAAYTGPS
ncbi:MAG: hypothetical protein IPM90_00050 [Austwickia sp.]|nr:hypothetical protein [Austwickia sp.]